MPASYLFQPDPQSPNILLHTLMYSLDWSRNTLVDYIENLSIAELDAELLPSLNSIGTLLAHIAAMECYYRAITFEGREYNEAELQKWSGAITGQMRQKTIRRNNAAYYISLLEAERQQTRSLLSAHNDKWLFLDTLYAFGAPVNNYYCWFHYMEDEIRHLGQIRMIRSNLKNN
jgi:uncharacterized damage-inducible protein DinB